VQHRRTAALATASALVLLMLFALVTGCSSEDTSLPDPTGPKVPDRAPDIRGVVVNTTRTAGQIAMLVEGDPEGGTTYDRASVTVTGSTKVLHRDGTSATLANVPDGARIEVWFTGPVAESYPVQATADVILILGG